MKRLSLLVAIVALCLPTTALAGGYIEGAQRSVRRVAAGEGEHLIYVRCHRTAPSRFGCRFLDTVHRTGRVSVNYIHGHYYVGEPRFDPPPVIEVPPLPCLPSVEICVRG